ncbi:MAG: DNA polymerase III subunit alpha [Marinilabiliaceae bacterium]|jgi:DNA polymerase-3 subunit alpha|nr:DNA polymerase III subunit alpha [Marinilabiliaceae bacterium]
MSNFVHLHLHTQYSILDGASKISELMKMAAERKMKAVAITDHGNMFGVKEFHNAAKASGVLPIIGCETYVARRSLQEITDKEDRSGHHMILLAKNYTGYKNLVKMVSIAWTEGFYYKPRIDKSILKQYSEGIIATTACIAGEVPQAVLNNNIEEAEILISEFKEIFADDFYLEVQRHKTGNPRFDNDTLAKQNRVFEAYRELSDKLGVKIIASNDVHFLNSEDAEAHDRLICLNTGKELDDPDRLRYTMQEYFKSEEEMRELFSDFPEVIDNTMEIAGKVEFYELDHEPIMPDFPIPDRFENKDAYLRHLAYEGARMRWGELSPEIEERLDFELDTIKKMGYPGYFLIVQDFLNAAREMGVSVGPGRGSAAGSAVAYALRITDIDPIKYNLLFERFLNPDRISMPDIDIDFDEDGREEVLKYVVEKYGHDHVAHIITFGTMAAKMAIRDVARVQNLPLSDADRLAKLIPEKPGTTFRKAYDEVEELVKERDKGDELVARTLQYAEALEGSVRQTGVHACAIIIGRDPLDQHIPISTAKDTDLYVTQYDGSHVESVGLLKMDFLGLKTLSIIKDAVENIKYSTGEEIDIDNIPLDDEMTFELYSRGETTGLFQFESEGMKKHLRDLKPNRFEDLIAMNALYRPGPMEYIPKFIRRKHGLEKIEYQLPEMEKHLKDTYGITVYQEQVMVLSQELAGFTRGQADSLRKAMGKKKKDIMDKLKIQFIEGCRAKGHSEKITEKIWHDWEAFAQYAFNKSHSTCYAFISYQTAWLKAHYPAQFMAAVLSRNISDIKKVTTFMDETRRMGMDVLGPNVNESFVKFTVNSEGNVRFGLGAIKGVGESAIKGLIEEREKNGPFVSVYDFMERVNLNSLNKKSIEAMVLAGAFDLFEGIKRSQFFAENQKAESFIESLIKYGNRIKNESGTAQQSLFGETEGFEIVRPALPETPDWPKLEKLNKEKEVIGIFLSAHPLDDYKLEIESFCNVNLADLSNLEALLNKEVVIAGMVTEARSGTTKTGKPFGSLTVQDYTDSFRFMMFDKDYVEYSKYFTPGFFIMIKAKVQKRRHREEEIEVKVSSINLLTSVREEMIKSLSIIIPVDAINDELIDKLMSHARESKGNTELKFIVFDPADKVSLQLFSRSVTIDVSNGFIKYIKSIPGIDYKVN